MLINLNYMAQNVPERVLKVARQSLRSGYGEFKRRYVMGRSKAYRFDVPAGYLPRSIVLELGEIDPRSQVLLPDSEDDFETIFSRVEFQKSELLGRPYKYLESGRAEINLGESLPRDSHRTVDVRIAPWGFGSAVEPKVIVLKMDPPRPSLTGKKMRLSVGQVVKEKEWF